MQRLFKKYKLLLWLGLLLSAGFAADTAVTLMMSRDLLTQQSASQTLPAIGDALHAEIRAAIAQALTESAAMANDAVAREWFDADVPDDQRLIAHLKSLSHKDSVIARFVVAEKEQKYLDSLGTVRGLNPDSAHYTSFTRARNAGRPVDISIDADTAVAAAPLLIISYRMMDAQQQFAGTAGATFTLAGLAAAMNHYVADGARAIYFTDRQGKIIFSDSQSKRSGNLHQQDGISAVTDDLLKDQQKIFSTAIDKTAGRVLLNARYIPELDWFLIEEENVQPVSSALWPLGYANAAAGIVVTLLALLIAGLSIAQYQSRMRALASRDNMTGLLNRQFFTHSFQEAVLEMQRLNLPMSFILFDIDFLKKINESHGHAIGDKIITDIARLSKRSVRGSDLLCRWGGEQFAVLVKRCELEQAYKIAEQLRLNVQNHAFSFADQEASVTISLGVAQWTENESIDELFGRVDDAVFLAKSEGRNRAEISYYVSA